MVKSDKTLVCASWIVVEPAEEIPGVWVAHYLDFDVISQGDSPQLAIEAVKEAVAMVVVDDLCNGLDPRDRERAPAEYWDRLAHVLKHGRQIKLSDVRATKKMILATEATLVVERVYEDKTNQHSPQREPFFVPPATAHIDQMSCHI